MFALSSMRGWENGSPSVNLKCDPEQAEELRANYESIVPGFHMNKMHWNTVYFNGDVPDKMMRALIDESYGLVVKSLTKKAQAELDDLGN